MLYGECHLRTDVSSGCTHALRDVTCLLAAHGGGWGYSGHSIEAIRFVPDTDVMIGGFGLFGGRGEYYGKIKVSDMINKPSS